MDRQLDASVAGDAIEASPRQAWCSLAILYVLAIVSFLDRQIISLLVEPIKRDLHLTDTEFSLAQGLAFAITFCAFAIPLGYAADRFSRRSVLSIGVSIWSLGSAGCGLAAGATSLVISRMLLGSGEAALTPAALSLIGDNFRRRGLGVALGIYGSSAYVGFGASMLLGGTIIAFLTGQGGLYLPIIGHLAPWRATFLIVAMAGIPCALLAWAIFDPRTTAAGGAAQSLPMGIVELWRETWPALLPYLAGIGALSGAFSAVASWTPAFLIRSFSLGPAEIGAWLGFALGVMAAAGSILAGVIIERLLKSQIVDAAFRVAMGSAILAAPILILAHLADTPRISLLLICAGLGVFGGVAGASYGSIQAIAPASARGKVAALSMVSSGVIGGGLAPVAVALVTDYVFGNEAQVGNSIALVTGVLCLIGICCFWTGLAPLRHLTERRAAGLSPVN